MRIVWSLWTKPLFKGGRIGWRSHKDHLLSWILSVESARRHYEDTCLVTDDLGAAMLLDGLGLEFGSVSFSLNALAGQDPDWWALGKLYAYSEQSAPFLHIDSDVYLWKPLPAELLAAPVIASHPEYPALGRSCYRPEVLEHELRCNGGWIPPEFERYMPLEGTLRAENCGIFGGHRTDFIQYYTNMARNFVHHPDNLPIWNKRSENYSDAILFEQFFLSACLAFHRGRKDSPFADIEIRYLFESLEDAMSNAAGKGFTHVIAGTKQDRDVTAGLERVVKERFPSGYERCLDYLAVARLA